MVTMALATAAPAGSTTLPSMVPAFPSDWPNTGGTTMAKHRSSEPRARVFFILPVLGDGDTGPSLISPPGGMSHDRAGNGHERAHARGSIHHCRICRILWAWRLLTTN